MKDYNLYYGIPTYNQFDRAAAAIQAIYTTSTVIPDQIVVIDNSETGGAVQALQPMMDQYPSVHVIPRQQNILAAAWNDIMRLFDNDYVIIANDDVIPHPQAIEALVTAGHDYPDYAMLNGSGHSGNSYSFFLLRQWAYRMIGPFDEHFIPAYFEDNDYDYRLKLLDLIRYEVINATFDHYGSATMRALDERAITKHHRSFGRNQRYYMKKWGGMPGAERFTEPFAQEESLEDD